MHEVSKGAGIYSDIETKYDTIDPESEDIYAPAGLYLSPESNSKAAGTSYDHNAYNAIDEDLDDAYDAIDEDDGPSVPPRAPWSQNNSSSSDIYTEPASFSTQDNGIYLGIGDDDIDVDIDVGVDVDVDVDEGDGNDVYMSIADRTAAFGFGRKASLKKASTPTWKQKQRQATTSSGNDLYMDVTQSAPLASQGSALPTWKQRQRQQASKANDDGNDIYMDVADPVAAPVSEVVAEDAGSFQQRASTFGFDTVPFGKTNSTKDASAPSATTASAAAANESSTDDVYMDIATDVAKGTSGDIRMRASSFLQSPGAILETKSPTKAKPHAAVTRSRLPSEHFEGFGGDAVSRPPVAYGGVLDWKAAILKKKAEKHQETQAKQEKEQNKYAHLPEWKQALILKRQAKLAGATSGDAEA